MNKRKPWNFLAIVAALALLLPALVWAAYPAEIPRTGQTTCYDDNGTIIDCDGTGQDGAIQAGAVWPDPRFIDHGDNTTTDNLTGLMWANNANLLGTDDADNDTDGIAGDGAVTWQHALDYIKRLNRESYLGHNDWRLPNINELESLVNAELYLPALPLNYPFTQVRSGNYWSSTSSANFTFNAWIVDMYNGNVSFSSKTYDFGFVWPVRAGQCGSFDHSIICLPRTGQTSCYNSAGTEIDCADTGQDGAIQAGAVWPDPRFIDHGDNTTTDNLTGLMWANNANLLGTDDADNDTDGTAGDGAVTWQHALDYIKKLNSEHYLNYTDWRLPNTRELRSLADYELYGPALPLNYPFTNVRSFNYYWSSTSSAGSTHNAWTVGMSLGYVGYGNKANSNFVWPVRAGQVGHSIITTTTTTVGSTTTVPTTTTVLITTTSIISSTTTSTGGGSTTTTASSGSTTTSTGGATTTTPVTTTAPATTTTTPVATTTTTTTGICPAKKALGENNPNLENLRNFRDSKLAQSAVGRKAIEIYYTNADSINAALEHSPALRAVTRRVLEVIAPMVGKEGIGGGE
jgi:hypothetical protein